MLDWLSRRGAAGWRGIALSLALGASAALALPPIHLVPVLWLAFPGLLALLGTATTWRRAAALGFAWGWGFFVVGLYWITHALLTDLEHFWWLVPIAVPALALPMALFVAVPAVMAFRVRPGWARVMAFSGAWVVAELARGWLLTGFPWNLLGSVWAFDAMPIQGAAWIGVHGLSLVTLLIACAPLLGRRAMVVGVVVLAGFAALGAARLSLLNPAPQHAAVLIIQGNIEQELKWRQDQRTAILARYVDMTRMAAAEAIREMPAGQPLIVVWPETAVPYLLANDQRVRDMIAAALPEQAILVSGSVRADFNERGQAERLFNSLVALNARGEVVGLSDKVHLVPFGEYMPLSGLLPIRLAAGGMDFTPGTQLVTQHIAGIPAWSGLVCYEVIFPASVVPRERPEWLVNATNDAWFGVSAGPWQHLAAARMRAVEEGLPLVRAAQTGISAVFDASGRRVAWLGLAERGTVFASLPSSLPPTIFALFGLWIPALLAGLVLAVAISLHLGARSDSQS